MIRWLAVAFVAAVLLIWWAAIWRRWISPWRELEELVAAITGSQPPRKFLMTRNARANAIGLALEKLALRQRELERTAQESTRNVEAILGALPDGLAVVDQQRRLQIVNTKFRQLFATGENSVGGSFLEATRDGAADAALTRALSDGQVRREPMKITRGADTASQIEVSIVPFPAETGRGSGAVVLFRDVTQLQQIEAMRRDFVANVSHELRTPLSIFRGYLETLLDDPRQPPGELIRILEVMERHADRLTSLVDDVLSLARLESPEARIDPVELNIPEFLGSVLRDWEKRFAAKRLQAQLTIAPGLPPLRADEGRLQEIVYNLLDNAVKYSAEGGAVEVSATIAGDEMQLRVRDEGAGIPSRDLPRIFERFYRADKARSRAVGGTGLGLSIVKHIAQLHGGSVEAESELGRGTAITVNLPIMGPPAAPAVTES